MSDGEILQLKECCNCFRRDRMMLKAWRNHFWLRCDCGAQTGMHKRLDVVIGFWNGSWVFPRQSVI